MFETKERKALEKQLHSYLQTNRIRSSLRRTHVFQILAKAEKHLELSELLRRAKSSSLGEATVYRALTLFQKAGIVSKIGNAKGEVSYELSRRHHDHLICSHCETVIEFHSPLIERAQEKIARKYHFKTQFHRHEIFGLCYECTKDTKEKI